MFAGVFALGLYVLPIPILPPAALHLTVPPGAAVVREAAELPVFCLGDDHAVVRCGLAHRMANGDLRLDPYRGAHLPDPGEAVLANADIGLLWALADQYGRGRVRDMAALVSRDLVTDLGDLARSSTWRREYRDEVTETIRRISSQAWNVPATQTAFQALLSAIEPAVADSMATGIAPAMAPYVADALVQTLRTNAFQALSLVRGGSLDLTDLGPALHDALRDPGVRREVARLGPTILALPQTELLAEQLVSSLAAAVRRDTGSLQLLMRIVTDPRLEPRRGPLREHAGDLGRQLIQVLWGLGGGNALNPLAGVALRALMLGAAQPMLLLIDPAHAALLCQELPGRAIHLDRRGT